MFLRLISIHCFLIITFALQAQPFWMQPKNFFLQSGERLLVTFKSGGNFTGQPWDLASRKVKEATLHNLSRSLLITDSLRAGENEPLQLTIGETGTYLVALSTTPATRTLSGEEFDSYLKENGFDEALSERKKEDKLLSEAQESVAFFSKLLIKNAGKSDDTFKKVVEYPVEIIPLKDPYQLKIGEELRFKILINGKPVFGTRVKIWNRFNNRTTIQNIYTEQDGTILVRISSAGPWVISFAAMESQKNAGGMWKTNHASLVFGVKK